MQVGSLVKCIGKFLGEAGQHGLFIPPVYGNDYVVRSIEFSESDHAYIRVEEIINKPQIWPDGSYSEAQFDIDGFVEILPPMDISIEELIKETEPCH